MNISDFSTSATFEGVENRARLQRAEVKTASFVHGIKPKFSDLEPVMSIAARVLAEHHPTVTIPMIKGPSRVPHLLHARRHVWTVVHEERPDLSVSTIARMFNRDHSTVFYGLKVFAGNRLKDTMKGGIF